jgi:rhodanese-related sulfurtransferase
MHRALVTIPILLALTLLVACEDGPAAANREAETAPAPTEAVERQTETAEAETREAAIPELGVDEVARLLEARAAVVVDANGDATRQREGVVPSAMLLTSSGRYDPAAELPSDKSTKLVFYCGNEDCHASDGAAERARDAGYSDVNVMRAGIAGWKAAGRETVPPPA